ncbi:2-C-methyl-D-erythritol 2,4-cyclodiphosphate synthase [Thermosyntropha sp.]|uniref:2-C-methyl-D-erythritol 2,4-cyclodiphosphate synthase n=1 Tax=Thermosyntropha sp. TaxID=2740820 RepID=UPI0025FC5622|nr:2-C-methyl-D-erythritol 2,4-cyclodiphosphate synthase [Thermosyntropha sp.]MBO8158012.1 2-C-methyl-D-erythritol 2,4-cyclodiphosphate synthase [Thermosyntropha sp.]
MDNYVKVIVAAAGRGSRMKSSINKQYMLLKGKPVLAYSLFTLEKMGIVDEILIAAHPDEVDYCYTNVVKRYGFRKVKKIIEGGKERQDTVELGLKELSDDTELVAVHDGARPLFMSDLLENLVYEAIRWGAAVPGIRLKDTVKMIDEESFAFKTLNRGELIAVQTPQVFRYKELLYAYIQARKDNFYGTDDASLYEKYVGKVKIVPGDEKNIKITTPEDIIIAQRFLEEKKGEYNGAVCYMRVGSGYDVHKLVEGRKLILGGVEIPYSKGLLGHSDADVLLHAVCDALLGAAGLGDIGKHFPDTDERYKGIDSLVLLKAVGDKLSKGGFKIINIDSTIVAQEPKLASYIPKMRENIADALNLDLSRISVKATTTEGLGFEGQKEGISAQAVALIGQ